MSGKLHVRDFLPLVIPALLNVGWSTQRIRELVRATSKRMGEGGTTEQWLRAMGDELAATGDERAADAFLDAFERWAA